MLSQTRIFARISDNVLDDEDFPVAALGMRDGRVMEQSTMRRGAYEGPDLIGMTAAELLEWSRYDATGEHPEMRHELAPTPMGPWSSFCSVLPGAKSNSQ